MKCPEDGLELVVRMGGDDAGHACGACAGTWLPGVFVEGLAMRRQLRLADFYGTLTECRVRGRALPCPSGCGSLTCARIHGVEVDWCHACRGVWFNQGELAQVLERHPIRELAPADPNLAPILAAEVGINVLWALLFS